MIQIDYQITLSYLIGGDGADLILNVHAAQTRSQSVSKEKTYINQPLYVQLYTDPHTATRLMRLRAEPGVLHIQHQATVDIRHHQADPQHINEVPVARLPFDTLIYLNPSRYCQSDLFTQMATMLFGEHQRGYVRVQAVCDWVKSQVRFTSNSSNLNTSAVDTLRTGQGVCRDFAHLMITLCRALCIPARFTTGTDFGADPALGPPDFHAYVEVYLEGGWYLFDASGVAIPMGLIRIGTGRDAADVPFASIYGGFTAEPPLISSHAVVDHEHGFGLPCHVTDALSTDIG